MKRVTLTTLAAGLLISLALPAAAGQARVNFIDPDQFADLGRSSVDRAQVLKSLGDYIQKLGARLPEGQTLNVDVTDIDLAGELRYWGAHELRVLRGRADWPHLNLRWTLQSTDGSTKSGAAQLDDPNYLMALRAIDRQSSDLVYEKRMLRKWFEATFVSP